jgi:hypothetical protein
MSALGHKRTYAVQKGMSALPPKADMCGALAHVRFVPIADIRQWPDLLETLPDEAVNFNRAHDCDRWRL